MCVFVCVCSLSCLYTKENPMSPMATNSTAKGGHLLLPDYQPIAIQIINGNNLLQYAKRPTAMREQNMQQALPHTAHRLTQHPSLSYLVTVVTQNDREVDRAVRGSISPLPIPPPRWNVEEGRQGQLSMGA